MHLAAAADTGHLLTVKATEQLRNAFHHRFAPILRVLLAPAGLGKLQGIFLGHNILNFAQLIHQQKLCRGCTQVDADVQIHGITLLFLIIL